MVSKAEFYFKKENKWQQEIEQLRQFVLENHLEEDLKWGCPCYTFNGNNIVLIHVFKEYCALLFFKGVLLKDKKGLLIQQTENVQVARQMRFTNLKEVVQSKAAIKDFILQAVDVEEKGLKAPLKTTAEFRMPEEFQLHLNKDEALQKAFDALTPGRQKAYLLHFSQAKQSKTREDRIEKNTPRILEGLGLND